MNRACPRAVVKAPATALCSASWSTPRGPARHPGQRRQSVGGRPPGRYGEWAVDPSGKIVVAGTWYLAGSSQGLEVGLNVLLGATELTLAEAIATVTTNPARLLDRAEPIRAPGQPANLVVSRLPRREHEPGFGLRRTCVGGQRVEAGPGARATREPD
jgi:hypothetical protein